MVHRKQYFMLLDVKTVVTKIDIAIWWIDLHRRRLKYGQTNFLASLMDAMTIPTSRQPARRDRYGGTGGEDVERKRVHRSTISGAHSFYLVRCSTCLFRPAREEERGVEISDSEKPFCDNASPSFFEWKTDLHDHKMGFLAPN